jgi:hypothetical protein
VPAEDERERGRGGGWCRPCASEGGDGGQAPAARPCRLRWRRRKMIGTALFFIRGRGPLDGTMGAAMG